MTAADRRKTASKFAPQRPAAPPVEPDAAERPDELTQAAAEDARARRLLADAEEAGIGATYEPPRTQRTKKVRKTVDLYPPHNRALLTWCNETADMLGEARITSQDVLEALVRRLLTDETLARKIRADLRTRQGEK